MFLFRNRIPMPGWPLFLLFAFTSCDDQPKDHLPLPGKFTIRAADLSLLPEIEQAGVVFYNRVGQSEDMLTTLKNAGMNTVRIRLWYNPVTAHSGFAEVKAFAEKARTSGLKVWLSVHYSDTWADPGSQTIPEAWKNLDFNILKDSLYNYTARIVQEIKPDYIQTGNEINNGLMWPQGNRANIDKFTGLLKTCVKAVRDHEPESKIIIHYAGTDQAEDFFINLQELDYDIIGLSYYPLWHGKKLNLLDSTMNLLGQLFDKQLVIAETAYPFTLGWKDWTNNVTGLEEQLVDGYPATPEGQKAFLTEIKRISTASENSIGFAYWGGEWVSFRGPQATNGSPWENQAFYDFNLKALPVLDVYGMD